MKMVRFAIKAAVMLFLCGAFVTSKASENLELLRNAIERYFGSGIAPDYFTSLMSFYQFPHLFMDGMEHVYDNSIVCYLCNLVVNLVITKRRLGIPRFVILEETTLLCTGLRIETRRVCRGLINLNIDTLIYIIDNNPDLKSMHVCGMFLQNFNCPTGQKFDWSINISPGNSPERPKPKNSENQSFKILQLTDIHYDPEYTVKGDGDCGELICCQKDQGLGNSSERDCGYWSDYRNADTPWHLVQDTFRQVKTQKFDYVYFTGDIVGHRIWDTSITGNTLVIKKLYSFFKEKFDVPVFPVFGNHEPHPLNLWPTHDVDKVFSLKWLFKLAADHWSNLIGEDVSRTVLKGGYYSVSPKPGFRIIGINSNVAYIGNFWLLYDNLDPFDQLQWLADTLQKAEDNNESVHILSHIPTGSSFILKVWNREYNRIIQRYTNTITGQFNGHTHTDEIKVFYNNSNRSQAISIAFNGGSVTPYSNTNPGFTYYHVDSKTFSVLDYEQWYFNLTYANSLGPIESIEWQKLYSFCEIYGTTSLHPEELDMWLLRMAQDRSLLLKYFSFKYTNSDVMNKQGCDKTCEKNLFCDIVTTLPGDDHHCQRFLSLLEQ